MALSHEGSMFVLERLLKQVGRDILCTGLGVDTFLAQRV